MVISTYDFQDGTLVYLHFASILQGFCNFMYDLACSFVSTGRICICSLYYLQGTISSEGSCSHRSEVENFEISIFCHQRYTIYISGCSTCKSLLLLLLYLLSSCNASCCNFLMGIQMILRALCKSHIWKTSNSSKTCFTSLRSIYYNVDCFFLKRYINSMQLYNWYQWA